ncbi:MAG: hypothetical protein KBB07_04880 [Tepidiphilus sp.]|nr:hypothetical protein [Tepidiphilus sp.]MDD3432650.1 hypothetical protein [Tepidiphilus sp.]
MTARWLLWPALDATLLALLALLWWQPPVRWAPPEPALPAIDEVRLVADAAPASAAAAARARPLFWSSRRPPPPSEAGSAQALPLAQAKLLAVLEGDAQRIAIVRFPDGHTARIATKPGADGWRLAAFDGRTARFERPSGGSVSLRLEAAPAAAAKPPAKAVAPASQAKPASSKDKP